MLIAAKNAKIPKNDNSNLKNQLISYINQGVQDINSIKYWTANQTVFPILAKKFFDISGMPSTQVESERLFSSAGLLIDDKRNRLEPEKAEKILVMHRYFRS